MRTFLLQTCKDTRKNFVYAAIASVIPHRHHSQTED